MHLSRRKIETCCVCEKHPLHCFFFSPPFLPALIFSDSRAIKRASYKELIFLHGNQKEFPKLTFSKCEFRLLPIPNNALGAISLFESLSLFCLVLTCTSSHKEPSMIPCPCFCLFPHASSATMGPGAKRLISANLDPFSPFTIHSTPALDKSNVLGLFVFFDALLFAV